MIKVGNYVRIISKYSPFYRAIFAVDEIFEDDGILKYETKFRGKKLVWKEKDLEKVDLTKYLRTLFLSYNR